MPICPALFSCRHRGPSNDRFRCWSTPEPKLRNMAMCDDPLHSCRRALEWFFPPYVQHPVFWGDSWTRVTKVTATLCHTLQFHFCPVLYNPVDSWFLLLIILTPVSALLCSPCVSPDTPTKMGIHLTNLTAVVENVCSTGLALRSSQSSSGDSHVWTQRNWNLEW